MSAKPTLPTPLGDTSAFAPSAQRTVRVRTRSMPADTHVEPHRHAWAQLAYCTTGVLQVTVSDLGHDSQRSGTTPGDQVTYIVPPSRAVWVTPGALHAVTVLQAAEFRTLYIDPSVVPSGWTGCRVMVVSNLMRELIHALDAQLGSPPPQAREQLLTTVLLDEITHATTQALGVPMPHFLHGDKRLRALCEAVLRAPGERATLAEWASHVGASERTVARLFRTELGTSYQQWRQQAVLANALPMLARGVPVSQVGAASGYASDSAFSAMFKAAMGQSPSHFQSRGSL